MPVLRIPTPLRVYTGGQSDVTVSGVTVSAALADLTARHPDIRPHIMKDDGELRAYVNLFRGEENVANLQGLQTPLAEDDRLRIIPSIAGG
ncbi:MAG TPA: ubiquitin-like small modifier protein 1 [Anaerolineaceae bacterium]|nr:ubiquitin-like small modifier protein 1 [Anaerolineaceae bacterium]